MVWVNIPLGYMEVILCSQFVFFAYTRQHITERVG